MLRSGKFESFVAETIVNKTFTGLKLATSTFLIATLFDERKKKLLHVHFKKLNSDLWITNWAVTGKRGTG